MDGIPTTGFDIHEWKIGIIVDIFAEMGNTLVMFVEIGSIVVMSVEKTKGAVVF